MGGTGVTRDRASLRGAFTHSKNPIRSTHTYSTHHESIHHDALSWASPPRRTGVRRDRASLRGAFTHSKNPIRSTHTYSTRHESRQIADSSLKRRAIEALIGAGSWWSLLKWTRAATSCVRALSICTKTGATCPSMCGGGQAALQQWLVQLLEVPEVMVDQPLRLRLRQRSQ